jgi:hypothetical protein
MEVEKTTPALKKRTVLLTDQLIERVKVAAKRDGREFSAQVRWMLEAKLNGEAQIKP